MFNRCTQISGLKSLHIGQQRVDLIQGDFDRNDRRWAIWVKWISHILYHSKGGMRVQQIKPRHTRMSGFYLLNPHPAFTVVQDMTDPFDPNRPPPIVPIKVTLDQIDALLAYMQGLQPADLGAPIKHQ